jgi:hypothetical protein
MMMLQWLWVRLMVVETRGLPLEQVQQRLAGAGQASKRADS